MSNEQKPDTEMSHAMQCYYEAKALMEKYPEYQDFTGPASEEAIQEVERILGVSLPPSYRQFCKDFGSGSFRTIWISGVINDDPEKAGVVATTKKFYKNFSPRANYPYIHDQLLGLSDEAESGYICMDLTENFYPNEAEIVRILYTEEDCSGIKFSFGEYLLEYVSFFVNS